MRENRTCGSEVGEAQSLPYPYPSNLALRPPPKLLCWQWLSCRYAERWRANVALGTRFLHPKRRDPRRLLLDSGLGNSGLALVFALAVFISYSALLVGLQEDELRYAFASVYLRGEVGGIGEFQGDVAFPFGLQGCYVDDDAAAGVGRFAEADCQHVPRYAKILYCPRQGKGIGWDDADVVVDVDEAAGVKVFGVDDRGVDIGEDFEFGRATHVVAIAR